MYLLIVRLRARPETVDALCQQLSMLVALAREEPGTLAYSFYRAHDEPDVFLMHEVYRDRAAWKAHMASEPVQRALATFDALLVTPPAITSGELVEAHGLTLGETV
ncbi:putative quinol monooxygenase [Ralstonia sp. 24A2]|uniref:putative quinol monooxygenase n=1 Tax=Ralstonia sp. 24A2 TaxID=3447364 RepID=UPI003F6A140E